MNLDPVTVMQEKMEQRCKANKLELLDRIENEYQKEYLGQNQGELYRSIIDNLRKEIEHEQR